MMAAPFLFLVLVGTIALALVSLVRSRRIFDLEDRVARLERAILRLTRDRQAERSSHPDERGTEVAKPTASATGTVVRQPLPAAPARPSSSRDWEELIGKRWLGWVGIAVLILGSGFGLKFAFESRWIGNLGRVSLGLAAGVCLCGLGQWQQRLGRRGFSQALTAGGVTLLYLSVYASYGFYDLVNPTVAFVFLTVIVLQAHLVASFQNAPGIALMGQVGGFLAPVLLASDQDRYLILFSYILLLNGGAILATALRRWRWISSVSFALTHVMFWSWWEHNYHPDKLWAAVAFLSVAFALFVFADLEQQRGGRKLGLDNWNRLFLNPFLTFAAAYTLLEPEHPAWMGALALALAVAYAALAHTVQWKESRLALVGISGLFATLAIPIQLDAHWVTLAWALQATVLFWLASRDPSAWLVRAGLGVFGCATLHYLAFEAPWGFREAFTPILNPEFASAAAVAACLLVSAALLRGERVRIVLGFGLGAVALLWLASTLEAYSYFAVLARETPVEAQAEYDALVWAGQTTVSVIWALFSAGLVAGGMRSGIAPVRWSGLGLFGITVAKVLLFDVEQLEGGYRVAALLVLGSLLVGAAWAYQRRSRRAAGP